jgi:hypothetical protein
LKVDLTFEFHHLVVIWGEIWRAFWLIESGFITNIVNTRESSRGFLFYGGSFEEDSASFRTWLKIIMQFVAVQV